jgi:hypothetical protein
MKNTNPTFRPLRVPGSSTAWVPTDVSIRFPTAPGIPTSDLHYLAYIPWDSRFLEHIPERYRDFFTYVLPHLGARTSNVHTALSVAQVPYLLKGAPATVDKDALYYALILHDCGWSEVSQESLVASLSYGGVAPTSSASLKPKRQHLIYGEALAYKLLGAYSFRADGPDPDDQYYIAEIVRRHDNDAPWEKGKYGEITIETKLVCDGDRLWSYTHENFWLDTVRKGIAPEIYIDNIEQAIDTYFFTEQGKARARQLAAERRIEVAVCVDERVEDAAQKPETSSPRRWRLRNIGRRTKV